MTDASLPQAYFDRLYDGDADPWGFRTSDYEREKYRETVQALDGRRFAHAVEVGCSIGELTAELAPSCDQLLGVDIAEAPLKTAAARNRASPHVRFAQMSLPDDQPEGRFGLIVLSEVLYYFAPRDLQRVAEWACKALEPDGIVLAVHLLGETPDYPQSGDQAAEAFIAAVRPVLTTDLRSRRALYRLDRLRRG